MGEAYGLAMSATAVATTTVEPATAAAMEPTTTAAVEPAATTAVEPTAATMEATTSAVEPTAATMEATTSSVEATAAVEPASIKAMTTVETTPTVESVTIVEPARAKESTAAETPTAEPRASSDKDAAHEVVRTVVSVRCASIRIITVITEITHGCGTVVAAHWTNSDAHRPLRISVRRSDQGECQAGTENNQIL
jgi:hypothetical protein